ncbi:MAG: hypothetical protein HY321_02130 [Armatimonadetes bacterium]|nr:hypothetical protein [Armatimonadota bacterium]
MNWRAITQGILHYRRTGPMPVVHFGFWGDTLRKWVAEGHLTAEEISGAGDSTPAEQRLAAKLGFDFNYHTVFNFSSALQPGFPTGIVETLPDGSRKVRDSEGAVVLQKAGATGIPMAFDHALKDRASWEAQFRHRLRYTPERFERAPVLLGDRFVPFNEGGREFLVEGRREFHYGLFCGSLLGQIRSWLGMEGMCYLQADDPGLFREIVDATAEVWYRTTKAVLETGAQFDFGHFWEDICFRSGPLITPRVFQEVVGPHYRRITDLLRGCGIDIVSLDCDGCIDALVPIWIENGVNTMFPIEVGVWNASIRPWRAAYGRELRGVGGTDKRVFARDRAAVDAEIERLKPLVDPGGYIPCPDHRIPPDARWDSVRYYCDRMRAAFG